MDITNISIDLVMANTYNPNVVPEDILAKLRAEIRQKGLCEPIIVRSKGKDSYEVVDGYHRWLICRELAIRIDPDFHLPSPFFLVKLSA